MIRPTIKMHLRTLKKRALEELRRELYQRQVFYRNGMVDLAHILAEKYANKLTQSQLLTLDEAGHGKDPFSIRKSFREDLWEEMCRRLSRFWDGQTRMELRVHPSTVELVGFFNGRRPPDPVPDEPLADPLDTSDAPYA